MKNRSKQLILIPNKKANNLTDSSKALLNTVDSTGKYLIVAMTDGSLTITKRDLFISAAASGSKYYDGTPLTVPTYAPDAGQLMAGDEITGISVVGTRTDIGSSDNVLTGTAKIMRGTTDVTDSYDIRLFNGILTVMKVTPGITVKAESAERD